jgi:hypothetical protein
MAIGALSIYGPRVDSNNLCRRSGQAMGTLGTNFVEFLVRDGWHV